MKCPKCGYNSFESHDVCKKCANDLSSYKDIHGLKAIVLPFETRAAMAEKLRSDATDDTPAAVAETASDMFSFDVPDVAPVPAGGAFPQDDPFNFDIEPTSASAGGGDFAFDADPMSAQARAEEEAFAGLLEATSQKDAPAAPPEPPPAFASTAGSELNSFSWDDTPDPSPAAAAKPPADDFDSLFGDTDETGKN